MNLYSLKNRTLFPTARAALALSLGVGIISMSFPASFAFAEAEIAPMTVTINKVIDGVPATAGNAASQDFPMLATYTIGGVSGGPSAYALSALGYNGDPTPYQAQTSGLNTGDSYSTYEDTSGTTVGLACSESDPMVPHFALVGYTTGNTYAAALAAIPSMTVPSFPSLQHDKFVIVWNRDCTVPLPASTVTVSISKYIDGVHANATNATSSAFLMDASWNAANIGAGTGQYSLDTTNTPAAYEAETADMTSGADYSTSEVMNDVVGTMCSTTNTSMPRFALTGYTSGNTLAAAQAATPTMTAPTFTGLTQDKYVIVWNHDCAVAVGEIGGVVTGGQGVGILGVTSVEATDTTATSDGTFGNGWKYVFNITVPTNEINLAMKFADWVRSPASGSIAVANNMRISSAQANNAGATILLTAANTYSTPDLTMVGDLSTSTPGLQVQVLVEVAIPVGTLDGAYSTSYGVRTL